MNNSNNSRTIESRRQPLLQALAFGLLLAVLALTSILMTADRASAHAEFERSEPAEGSVVAQSPERVDMWFGQEMARSGGLPSVVIVNQAGDVIADEPVLDDEDRTHMYIELPPELPERRYTVIWHNLSDEDGEEGQGAFHFYVGQGPEDGAEPTDDSGGGTIAPTTVVSDTGGDDDGGDGAPWWVVAVVAVGGLSLGAAGTFAVAGGRSGNRDDEPGASP